MCSSPVPSQPTIVWISQLDAHKLLNDHSVVFVDARPVPTYEQGHIAGAVSIPMDDGHLIDSEMKLVRNAQTVVTYCDTSQSCALSSHLAGLLSAQGLPDVRVLEGGFPNWLSNGYPAEAGVCRQCK